MTETEAAQGQSSTRAYRISLAFAVFIIIFRFDGQMDCVSSYLMLHVVFGHFLLSVPCTDDKLALLGFERLVLAHVASSPIGHHGVVVIQEGRGVVLTPFGPGPRRHRHLVLLEHVGRRRRLGRQVVSHPHPGQVLHLVVEVQLLLLLLPLVLLLLLLQLAKVIASLLNKLRTM